MSHAHSATSHSGILAMNALPVMDGNEVKAAVQQDWSQTLPAALEEARTAASVLRELVQDAVFLDEDCYITAVNHTKYQQRLQVGALVGEDA